MLYIHYRSIENQIRVEQEFLEWFDEAFDGEKKYAVGNDVTTFGLLRKKKRA
jgi:hypothetical protein